MSKINEGYPGDKLSRTRSQFIQRAKEKRKEQENITTGCYCLFILLIFLTILVVLLLINGLHL